jgi:hypothetical protein
MAGKLPYEGFLLVSDMDRTLVTEDFKIPERNIEAIDRFIEKGGLFALATGRVASSAAKYFGRINTNAPSILSNGSSIYDFRTDKILWCATLPDSAEIMLAHIMEKFPDIGAEVYRNEEIYIINSSPWTEKHIVNEGFKFYTVNLNDVPHGWQKILLAGENMRLREVEEYVCSLKHDGYYFVFSNLMYYEALPEGVSKGTTLKRLSEMLNIKTERTFAIGDYYNDLTLVSMAGFGATVAGAPDELRDASKLVVGRCEDGAVADLIEYIENNPHILDSSL